MPVQQKTRAFHKRSRSSSEHHHKRRTYEKDKSQAFDKYHRRSRSRSPKDDAYKGKYTSHYQHKEQRRYHDHYREADNGKHYGSTFPRRETFEKRDREKTEEYPAKPKYNRYDEKEPSRNREREMGYDKRERGRNSPEHQRKRRRSSSSKSRSSSRKETKGPQNKFFYAKRSPSDRLRDHDSQKRNKKSMEIEEEVSKARNVEDEKARLSPPKAVKTEAVKLPLPYDNQHQTKPTVNRTSPTMLHRIETEKQEKPQPPTKTFFKLKAIPPPPKTNYRPEEPQRLPVRNYEKYVEAIEQKVMRDEPVSPTKKLQSQPKEVKPQQFFFKAKVNQYDLLLSQARQNLTVAPPKSTFLFLEAFRTMNKFQVETLDQRWMSYLKKDMEKYPQERDATMLKLTEPVIDEPSLVGKQYMWMKDDRNEQELDLRFRFEQFKQHNANVNELIRKMRIID